jgi:hypothetical protein
MHGATRIRSWTTRWRTSGFRRFPCFSCESESFLSYQRRLEKGHGTSNCHSLFGMKKIPTDNYIRLMLDPVSPESLQPWLCSWGSAADRTLSLFGQCPSLGIIHSTAATIIDPLIEDVSECGIDLVGASTATITSGTCEGNGTGLCIAAGPDNNTVIGLDMESNNVQDANDAANSNHYENVIASSNSTNAIRFTAKALAEGAALK